MLNQDALTRVIRDVVAPSARLVDRQGAYPKPALDALADAGLLTGLTMREAATVVEALAVHCGSTAMVVLMHYSALAAIEAHAPEQAERRHICTLAFSEPGTRSHFWAPQSTATEDDGRIRLDAAKSWVTSAGHADSYVWSTLPLAGDGAMTLWLVPADAPGLSVGGEFDGLGLRGNASRPMRADGVVVDPSARLGGDGEGLDIALNVVLPWFLVLNAAASVGLMEAATAETAEHVTTTRLEHLGQSLADQPLCRADLARMRIETDKARALLRDTLDAVEHQRDDAMLRVLEVKAACAEAAIEVTDLGMKLCGGAAFRREVGIERRFRDARAARVMAPTTDALVDFVGRAVCGMPVL